MDDRTSLQAITRYKGSVSLLLSCVISQPVPLVERQTDTVWALRLPQRRYWLRGDHTLLFSNLEEFRVVSDGGKNGPWRVERTAYFYQLYASRSEELLGFHWHPETPGPTQFPHLHAASDTAPLSHKTHVPTGFVSLGAVVRLLITEFGVPPLRDDWQTTLGNE